MSNLLTVIAQMQLFDQNPPQDGFRVDPVPFAGLLVLGFLIATAGHVVKSRATVAFGIALIFAVTVIVPILLALAN